MKKIVFLFIALMAFVFPPDYSFSKGGGGSSSSSSSSRSSSSSSSSSSRSYSSPSRSYSSPSPSRSYSSQSQSSSLGRFSAPSAPSQQSSSVTQPKPKTSFDSSAQRAHSDAASKEKFDAYKAKQQPQQSPSAVADAKDRQIQSLRSRLANTRMENRELRERQFYSRYYNYSRPTIIYHDNFNYLFWYMLLEMNQRDRDMWVYNHRAEMDQARFDELKAKDADMENRLRAMEQAGVKQDTSYVPAGVDPDLVYTKEHVEKVMAVPEENSSHVWIWVAVGALAVAGLGIFMFVPMVRR